MKQLRREKPRQHTDMAEERIDALFDEADSVFQKDKALSDRYIWLALRISTRYKVRLPLRLKKRFCRHCQSYLRPPINCSIRLNQGKLVYSCRICGGCMRYPYKAKAGKIRQPSPPR